MTLKDLNIGETAVVGTVGGEGALRQHFLDMGLIPGEEVTLVKFAPMGDPMELSIHGYELTLRLDDAAHDLFTFGALGLHAGNVYARCTHDPLSLGELAQLTGSDAAHTVQTLTRLIEADVLLLSRDGWHKPAADRRDAAADARGVTGRLAARAERYAVADLF